MTFLTRVFALVLLTRVVSLVYISERYVDKQSGGPPILHMGSLFTWSLWIDLLIWGLFGVRTYIKEAISSASRKGASRKGASRKRTTLNSYRTQRSIECNQA